MKDAKFRGVFFSFDIFERTRSQGAAMLHGVITELQRDNGYSIATNKVLAEKLPKNIRKTVQNKLDLLEQLGLLEIKQFKGKRILTAKEPGT